MCFDGLRWRAVNDVDLLVVYKPGMGSLPDTTFKNLGKSLARTLAVDFVDIGCLPRTALASLPATMENFDLKWSSHLLAGQDTRTEIPAFQPSEIMPYELIRLLCNRTAGLLSCSLPQRCNRFEYRANQYRKACIAVGDVAVYLNQGYHGSYRVRFDRFRQLRSAAMAAGYSAAHIDFVDAAYRSKLEGVEANRFVVPEEAMKQMIAAAFVAIVSRATGSSQPSVAEAERALIRYYGIAGSWRDYFDGVLCARLGKSNARLDELRQRILFSLPEFYCRSASENLTLGFSVLRRFWYVPKVLQQPWNRLAAVRLWEEYCH